MIARKAPSLLMGLFAFRQSFGISAPEIRPRIGQHRKRRTGGCGAAGVDLVAESDAQTSLVRPRHDPVEPRAPSAAHELPAGQACHIIHAQIAPAAHARGESERRARRSAMKWNLSGPQRRM